MNINSYAIQLKDLNPSDRLLERNLNRIFVSLSFIFAIGIGLILVAMTVVITIQAWPAIVEYNWQFFTQTKWNPVTEDYGALAMICGTIVSSLIALIIAVPLGVGAAIFLSENFIPKMFSTILVFTVEILASIPSVVYGLWGIFVLIPLHKSFGGWLYANFGGFPLFSTEPVGPGMLPAGVILAMMILPIIIAISRDSLICLPSNLREASFALGATRWETIFRVLIPSAFSGIVGGVMLALGRAMGETMAVTMIIGNSNKLDISILAPANSIASVISYQFADATGSALSALMYATLVLMIMTLIINIMAEFIVNRLKAKFV